MLWKKILVTFALFISMATVISAQATSTGNTVSCGGLTSTLPNIQSVAPWYCPINSQVTTTWSYYSGIAVVAVLIAFGIAALIFMIGVSLRDERIKNYGVGEIYEALASAIIVGAFIYICAVLFGYGPAFFVGANNPYAISLHLIQSLITQTSAMYRTMYSTFFTLSLLRSYSFTINVPALKLIAPTLYGAVSTFLANPFAPAIRLFYLNPAAIITGILSNAIWILYVEYYLLIFFSVASIPVLIIPGVILRALIPTRSLGGMMIALGIGFYLIMPTLFAVTYYFTVPSLSTQLSSETAQITSLSSGSFVASNVNGAAAPLSKVLSNVQSSISTFWLLILFFPPMIAGMTYAFVVQISTFIGGESQMGSRVRAFGGI
jgi:hypothetical protein